MPTKLSLGLVAAGLFGAGIIAAAPARAAPPVPGYTGSTASSVAGCPYITWRLVNSANGAVHGIAYYSDLSGLSSVTGTMSNEGQFHLVVTKTSIGDGPVGTVDGMRSANGAITAKMTGEGCANLAVDMRPTPDLNNFANSSGGR